jgi:hypothetical protein
MKAIVVYESHWGNTAAVAQAIAEGLGPDARALDTDAATGAALEGVGLIVAGSPVIAFSLPRESMKLQIAGDTKAPTPPDVSHPLLRAWLENLPWVRMVPPRTRIWWSPAARGDQSKLSAGYPRLARRALHRLGRLRPDEGRRARPCPRLGRRVGGPGRGQAADGLTPRG